MGLVVEKQPVFGAVGGKVEVNADVGETAVAMGQHAGFGACQDAGGNEGGGVAVYALCFGCPDKGVDVAQAAGAGFDVGFELCACALGFGVALLHFEEFGFDKGGCVAACVEFV